MKYETVIIGSSDSLSTATGTIPNNEFFCGFTPNENWTAAIVSFAKLDTDNATWIPVNTKDGTGEYVTGTIQPRVFTPIDFQTFMGIQELKVRSGTSSSPVAQTSDTSITIQTLCL
jgi:hypothetical protein